MLPPVFDKFVEKSPVSAMARGIIERVLNPVQSNQWYDTTAKAQYTRTLLFSSVFDIMNNVVCGSHHSVNAAFQALGAKGLHGTHYGWFNFCCAGMRCHVP